MADADDLQQQAYAFARLDAEHEADGGDAVEQPPPTPREQPPVLVISGDNVKVVFHGVGANDAYINPVLGMGIKHGPTGKAEYTCADFFSLNLTESVTTLGSFAGAVLKQRLGMTVGDLCSAEIKVVKLQPGVLEYAAPFEMVGVDTPVALVHKPGADSNVKLYVYVRAAQLRVCRAAAASAKWESFKEGVAGITQSANKLADLVGLGPGTLKSALSARSPPDGKARRRASRPQAHTLDPILILPPLACRVRAQSLSMIENFMRVHIASNFKELPVALAKLELKSGKRADPAPAAPLGLDGGGGEAAAPAAAPPAKAKRARTELSKAGRTFIDYYLDNYVALSGQAEKRAALYAAILQTAYVQQELLGSDKWTPKIIADRLHNALKARNKARAAAEGAEADAAAEAAAE